MIRFQVNFSYVVSSRLVHCLRSFFKPQQPPPPPKSQKRCIVQTRVMEEAGRRLRQNGVKL